MATITLGSNTYTLVTLPSFPGFADLTLTMRDSVAVVESPYVPSQVQTQSWPGADAWGLQATLPKMTRLVAAKWIAFLASLRGRQNVFQVGDQNQAALGPQGVARAVTYPMVDGTISGGNAVFAQTLNTKGWKPLVYRQLRAGDYIQVVSRLYMVLADVESDANGKIQIPIFPSLRETPADGTQLVLEKPVGVFRLANNLRQYHMTNDQLVQVSLQAVEAR